MSFEVLAEGTISLNFRSNPEREEAIRQNLTRIDEIWQQQRAANSGLFSGFLLAYSGMTVEADRTLLWGDYVPYEAYVAQKCDHELGLNIHPVGVSGLIEFEDDGERCAVIAKRSANTTQYPNCWELVPAGGIDRKYHTPDGGIDYITQLKQEFVEESGLPAECVLSVGDTVLVRDTADLVYDVCARICVKASQDVVLRSFKKSREYHTPKCIPFRELISFGSAVAPAIVPTSLALIEVYAKRDASPNVDGSGQTRSGK